jgi:hypothetical protein
MKVEFPEPQPKLRIIKVEVEVVCAFFVGEGQAFAGFRERETLTVAAGNVGAFAVASCGGEVFPEEVEDAADD